MITHDLHEIREEPEGEARWQKHALAVIGIALLLFVLICGALFYAETQGDLGASRNSAPPATWPVNMP